MPTQPKEGKVSKQQACRDLSSAERSSPGCIGVMEGSISVEGRKKSFRNVARLETQKLKGRREI